MFLLIKQNYVLLFVLYRTYITQTIFIHVKKVMNANQINKKCFQFNCVAWSNRYLGNVARTAIGKYNHKYGFQYQ